MKRRLCLLLIILAILAGLAFRDAGVLAQTSNQSEEPSGDAKNGRRIYTSYGCYECHGYVGQGSTATGPRLAPDPIPFSAFARYVREPRGDMPPYTAKVVLDQELADIYVFLRSLPHPPSVQNIPLLNQTN